MTLPAHTLLQGLAWPWPGNKSLLWEQHCVGHPPSAGHFTMVNCHGLFEPVEELVLEGGLYPPPHFRAKFVSECLLWHLVWG